MLLSAGLMKLLINKSVQCLPPTPIPSLYSGPTHPGAKVTELQNESESTEVCRAVLLTSTSLTAKPVDITSLLNY